MASRFCFAPRARTVPCPAGVYHPSRLWYNKTLMAKKPEFAMKLAIKGMLPANTVGAKSLTRCHIYAGANHKQQAQAPEAWVR